MDAAGTSARTVNGLDNSKKCRDCTRFVAIDDGTVWEPVVSGSTRVGTFYIKRVYNGVGQFSGVFVRVGVVGLYLVFGE